MSRQNQIVKLELAGIKFTWDDKKALLNVRNHRVAFEEAATCWLDPFKLETDDPEHSDDEPRWLLTGTSQLNRLLICWFTERKLERKKSYGL
jgi:hypothetical protein